MELSYEKCNLCRRSCGVNRSRGELGYCQMTDEMRVARIALHMWEEPIISGETGSGTVFFVGCSLGCVFCQNARISRGRNGKIMSVSELSDAMLSLEREGALNINFVTPTHFAPSVKESVILARERGLSIPIVYNTSSYDSVSTLRALSDVIDIYLADYKFYMPKTADELAAAENYPDASLDAIREMVRQKPSTVIENGIMKSGVIVRVLLLPSRVAEAKLIVKRLYTEFGDKIYISLMSQYTPMPNMKPPLDRRVTHAEYEELVSYAEKIGVKNGFTQEWGCADESFIPPF